MLELIFQGFVEWTYGLVLEVWEYFSSTLLKIMSMDFAYLKAHIPILNEILQLMLAVGWALLLGNLIFQATKSMATGLGFESEDPKMLFTRTFVFAFLLLASPQICKIGLNMTQTIIDILKIPDAVNITFPDSAVFGTLGAAWILVIICGIVIMFKVFRLILEMAERYIILAILTLCAPLAFGVGGSRSTSDIFTGWCRMYGSMCFLMVSHVVFFKMLLSVLSYIPSGIDVLPWMVLVCGIVKVAQKMDGIITRIGLNPAITGDGLGKRSLPGTLTYMIVRQMTSGAIKSVGKSNGGRGGTSSNPPSGGGPSGPKAGPDAADVRFRGTATSGSDKCGQTQNGADQGKSTAYSGAGQSTTQQQTPDRETGGGVGQGQRATARQQKCSRQSAVPPGARRAASHIRSTAETGRRDDDSPHDLKGTRSSSAEARFSSVQSPRHGDTSGNIRAVGQNNISAGAGVQEKSDSSKRGEKPQAPGTFREAGDMPSATRFAERTTAKAPSNTMQATASHCGSETTSTAEPSPMAAEHRQTGSGLRYGRNAEAMSDPPSISKTRPTGETARQESSYSTSATLTPRASVVAERPGMAGTATPLKRPERMRQTAQRKTTHTPAMPSAEGTKADFTTTARQEKERYEARRSNRKKDGGADNGQ